MCNSKLRFFDGKKSEWTCSEPRPSAPHLVGSDFLSRASFSEQEAKRELVPFPASFTDFHDPTRFGRQGNGNILLVNGNILLVNDNNSIHSI